MVLLVTALAPSTALLYYFYLRDKYEKEPKGLLIKAFFMGMLSIVPVIFLESLLQLFNFPEGSTLAAIYTSFIVAGGVEEGAKYLVLYFLIWKSREFDEIYDGIMYSVFISLGFASLENIIYVLQGGLGVALVRSITSVPAHALFGVVMGAYWGSARFAPDSGTRKMLLGQSFFVPVLLHGIYDFILIIRNEYLLLLFIPYILYLWKWGLENVSESVRRSPFR